MSEDTAPMANDHQVGGSHYKTAGNIQHWDVIVGGGVDYLRGCATKYVARARAKNGREDLEKAMHYLRKYQEFVKRGNFAGLAALVPAPTVLKLAQDMSLTLREARILIAALTWDDTDLAISLILEEIEGYAEKNILFEVFRPGTPEDGGHHARTEADVAEIASRKHT